MTWRKNNSPAVGLYALFALLGLLLAGCPTTAPSVPPSSNGGDGSNYGNGNTPKNNGNEGGNTDGSGSEHKPARAVFNFDEPAGISYAGGKLYIADTNNHKIRVVDLANGNQVSTLEIAGLQPPAVPPEPMPAVAAEDESQADEAESPERSATPEETGVAAPDEAVDAGSEATPPAAAAETDPRLAKPHPPMPLGEENLLAPAHPFPDAFEMPFDFPDGHQWVNTSKALKLEDFKGKFVLIDFWTYCCINCIHVLPELKKLERAFPNELVVIGVHSAKFDAEKGTKNIEEAVLRYEIEHPVVNDPEHEIWGMFGARSWPTLVLIDPEGKFVGKISGEIQAEPFEELLKTAIPYYRENDLLDRTPEHFDLLKHKQNPAPLRFPGKVLADEASGRLFIADSNNNRLVISTLSGKLIDTIGTGAIGKDDGAYGEATFNKPQGMALKDETLYVADTENHLLRKVDLKNKTVATIAGTGVQGRNAWPGIDPTRPFAPLPERFVAKPQEFAINSPWDLYIHGDDLYIAMAGPHQIWKMRLDESEIGPYAGNGREDIVDGLLLPQQPYQLTAVAPERMLSGDVEELPVSSFAQPSGLASDGQWLYVADSEGSSIRAVPLDRKKDVKTIVGTSHLDFNRLFEFGHHDGQGKQVRLQHCLGVAYHDGKIYVADTYNNAIKEIDVDTQVCRTIAGEFPEDQRSAEFPGAN